MTFGTRICILAAIAGCLAAAVAAGWSVSYDLAAFLPEGTTPEQRILRERFGQGPGTQVIYGVLPDASYGTATAIAAQLRGHPLVRRVFAEPPDFGLTDVPRVLTQSQFLLAEMPEDQAGWKRVLEARLADALLGDEQVAALISADPLLATTGALEGTGGNAPRFGDGDDRYLLILSSVPAFDGGAQAQLVEAIRAAANSAGVPNVALYGPGAYSADLQRAVRREATWFSLLASLGLVGLLLWRFRSVAVVAAISLPMLVGAAAGALAVTLSFGQVHGIAIAFGFTLLGVAVDYPLHTFSKAGRAEEVWPTLRIGVATTAVAYAVLLFGGSPGLSQLGLFAVVGVACAALATAWMRTQKSSPRHGASAGVLETDDCGAGREGRSNASMHAILANVRAVKSRLSRRPPAMGHEPAPLSNGPWIVVLLVALALLLFRSPFSDDLAALTPIPSDVLAADAKLRERMGANDMRHLVVVEHKDLEAVLQGTEAVARNLEDVRQAGALQSHQHVARLLPSSATQERRGAALDSFVANGGTALGSPFANAAQSVGYATDAFDPFHARAMAATTELRPLTRERLRADADLASFVDTHLYFAGGVWKSLVFLGGIRDHAVVTSRLQTLENVDVVDLHRASASLVGGLRTRLLTLLGCALIAMSGLLWLLTRDVERSAWVLGTVAACMALAAAATAHLRGSVSPFDLMALALVAGLVLDYSLFCSKPVEDQRDHAETRRAVSICALSSLIVFGLLSLSSIPVLGGIGTTVAVGVIAGYLLAQFGVQRSRSNG